MRRESVCTEYDKIMSGQRRYYRDDSFENPNNYSLLVHHALSKYDSRFKSKTRKKVVQGFNDLPSKLDKLLRQELRLQKVMLEALQEEQYLSLGIIKLFDMFYQQRNNDDSLFSEDHEFHIHPWDFTPNGYWKEDENAQRFIYHELTNEHPDLEGPRNNAIELIRNMPSNLGKYFVNLGLQSVMISNPNIQSSPIKVLQFYDRERIRRDSRRKSLFDENSENHLSRNDFRTRMKKKAS